jgi:4-amino-4-deoxy-L-arabinose transferase-like glycosyltransferase
LKHPSAASSAVAANPARLRTLLLSASLVLLLAWSIAVPVFESPDEVHHWQYARYLHEELGLPPYGQDFLEANAPPLYYMLLAPVATQSAFPPVLMWYDANGSLVQPFAPRFYHNAGGDFTRYWPIRAGRTLTVLMSLLTVWFCWQVGMHVGGTSSAVVCASLVAFLPQFTFRGSAVSNDALVTTLSAATLACIVRLLSQPFTWHAGALTALAVSAAYLTKINAICLFAPVALAVWWTGGPARERLIRVAGVLSLATLVAGPWSLRNIILYGDPFGTSTMPDVVGHIMQFRSLTSPYFWTTFPEVLLRSFIGIFGWMNVRLPEGYYWIYWVLGLSGLTGLLVQVATRVRSPRLPLVFSAIVILNLVVVVHINRSLPQPQGRYMFVALPALALLVTMGLDVLPRRAHAAAAAALAICLATLNASILSRYVIPAYYPPVTSTLTDSRVALSSGVLVDLMSQPDGTARVSGADPQIEFRTSFKAENVGFLAFDVSGTCNDENVDGTVYFAVDGQPASEAQQVPFTWRADGRTQLIRIPLLTHPLWKGTITALRIDPINASPERHQGDLVRVDNIRAGGNLSRLVP